jgi:hypothetical protein
MSKPSIVLFVLVCVIGVGGQYLFELDGVAATKRCWFPRYIVFTSVLVVAWVGSIGNWIGLVLAAPLVPYFDYVWITRTRFCDRCGAMTPPPNPFFGKGRTRCRCGADLLGPGQPSNWRMKLTERARPAGRLAGDGARPTLATTRRFTSAPGGNRLARSAIDARSR